MKLVLSLSALLLLATSASAETVYLDLGDIITVGGRTIVCGTSTPPVTRPWYCSVIPTNYARLYSGRGNTQQEANDQALSSCNSGLGGGPFANCDHVQCEQETGVEWYCSVVPTNYTRTYSAHATTRREAYDTALTSCNTGLGGGPFANCDHVQCSSN